MKTIILSLFLVLIVVISGCTLNTINETSVSTEQEAGEALMDVSTGVSDIETTLDIWLIFIRIDKKIILITYSEPRGTERPAVGATRIQ